MTILIAFWGVPLLTMLVVALACLVSGRTRRAAARFLGLDVHTPSSPQPGHRPVPLRIDARTDDHHDGRSAA
ncbi:MAG TPA: hypothetical protein VN627_04475 [Novosphingobium sp.]|nr:hypothetical protein [Novosphingobium sp.]